MNDDALALTQETPQKAEGQSSVSGICPPKHKYATTISIEIKSIDCSGLLPHGDAVEKLKLAVQTPWGQILRPVFVSAIEIPTDEKQWKLRAGLTRVTLAREISLSHVPATVIEGSEEEIRLKVHETHLLQKRPSAFQIMKGLAEYKEALKSLDAVYTAGGNQSQKAAYKKKKGLPSLAKLIDNVTGVGKTAFHGYVAAYEKLVPEAKAFLETNSTSAAAMTAKRIKKLAEYNAEEQLKMVPYLPKLSDPMEAYFQMIKDEAAKKGATLPQSKLFPVHHEPFWENAERIVDSTVQLIATDPNWELAEDEEEGSFWTEHGIPIAPKLTSKHWQLFGELAAKKLTKTGHLVALVGIQNDFEIETILRQYLRRRWKMVYLHPSGTGTPARKAGMASRQRTLLVFQRKDAPNLSGKYKEFVCDVIGEIPKLNNSPDRTLALLEAEQTELVKRIAEFKAAGVDPFTDDLIITKLETSRNIKKFHHWQQDVSAFQEIIRRFTKPGDFVWEPFLGSGTTAIAALTCEDWYLGSKSKKERVLQPRIGIGCDAMKIWTDISRYRVWDAIKACESNGKATDSKEVESVT